MVWRRVDYGVPTKEIAEKGAKGYRDLGSKTKISKGKMGYSILIESKKRKKK